jgi:hypothetical protein
MGVPPPRSIFRKPGHAFFLIISNIEHMGGCQCNTAKLSTEELANELQEEPVPTSTGTNAR